MTTSQTAPPHLNTLAKIWREIKRPFTRTLRNSHSQSKENYYRSKYALNGHFSLLANVNDSFGLRGKRVLEIGGSNLPREMLFGDFKVAQWVSVDYLDHWESVLSGLSYREKSYLQDHYAKEGVSSLNNVKTLSLCKDYTILNGSAANIPSCFNGYFDLVVSFSCLEHIEKFDVVLKNIYDCLKKNGVFYATAGAMYSSHAGHHFFVSPDMSFRTYHRNMIPPFAHLLMTPETLADHLRPFHSPELLEEIVQQCFHRDHINRLFYEDYERILREAPFERAEITPTDSFPPNDTMQKTLEQKFKGYSRFDVDHFEITAYKDV